MTVSVHRHIYSYTANLTQKSLTDRQTARTTIIVGIVLITRAHVHVRGARLGVTFFVAARLASLFLLAILTSKYAMSRPTMSKSSQYKWKSNNRALPSLAAKQSDELDQLCLFFSKTRAARIYGLKVYKKRRVLLLSIWYVPSQKLPEDTNALRHCGTWMVHLCRHHTVARRHRNRMY